MKKIINFLSLIVLIIAIASCKKESSVENPTADTKTLLTSKKWQVELVTEVDNGVSTIEYKKGALNNPEDYSKMRITFNLNGTVIFIDENGDQLNNAVYELLDNNKKIKITADGFPMLGENLSVTTNQFSFKVENFENNFTLYNFTPAL